MKPDGTVRHGLEQALLHDALDAWRAGRVDRRTALRYAAATGLSGLAAAIVASPTHAAASAVDTGEAARARPAPRPGATIRVANLTPTSAIDPVTASDSASICLLSQTCEFLIDDDGDTLTLRPALALAWFPDATARVWTFQLRRNVRFHDGQTMTAADVVASFDRLTDTVRGSAALSVFNGVLSQGGTRALDDHTVAFHLDAPNGNFPYYVSSDNYNAAILPARLARADPQAARYEQSFIGTGPFRLEHFTPRVGASFVRNPAYWGAPALPERVVFGFYADQQSQILALQGDDADIVVNFAIQGGRALLDHPRYKVQAVRSSSHRQVHMRCDAGPFADKRVRQALALSIDRAAIVEGIFLDRAQRGNDSPFAPVFPTSPATLPQRDIDPPGARARLAAAVPGQRPRATLVTEKFMEMPDYAVLLQNAAQSAGIDLRLRIESQSAYYGAAVRGQSDWLDSTIGITDYGHRGVPNVFLNATLSSQGAWNAARFRNPRYDALLARYGAALALSEQQMLATEIGRLLLDETPIIVAYFFDAMLALRADLQGVRFTAITQLLLAGAGWAAPGERHARG
ncbi:ABC transporter substrate-binding protein [Robbsia sp. Bb-Pol-6]|uniref:ABC transporter substrate-binding protein n=1 Tax=Robbsia betulipollinis TaxID=2981849 RepID=A0ABT3ZR83_9BURK|nr:ABC transporter substrate-binding protein [Robbsia betulipollinis]MCY0388787.1 ABC transporter substrate-binding protein [Robbsia betulipollinis]